MASPSNIDENEINSNNLPSQKNVSNIDRITEIAIANGFKNIKDALLWLGVPNTDSEFINKLPKENINSYLYKLGTYQAPEEQEKQEPQKPQDNKENELDKKDKEDVVEEPKNRENNDFDDDIDDRFDKKKEADINESVIGNPNQKSAVEQNGPSIKDRLQATGESITESIKQTGIITKIPSTKEMRKGIGGYITKNTLGDAIDSMKREFAGRHIISYQPVRRTAREKAQGNMKHFFSLAMLALSEQFDNSPLGQISKTALKLGAGAVTVFGGKRVANGLAIAAKSAVYGTQKGIVNLRTRSPKYRAFEARLGQTRDQISTGIQNRWDKVKLSNKYFDKAVVWAGEGAYKVTKKIPGIALRAPDAIVGVADNSIKGMAAAMPSALSGAIIGGVVGGPLGAAGSALLTGAVPFGLAYYENHVKKVTDPSSFRAMKAYSNEIRSYKNFLKEKYRAAGMNANQTFSAEQRLANKKEFISRTKFKLVNDLRDSIEKLRDPRMIDTPLSFKEYLRMEYGKSSQPSIKYLINERGENLKSVFVDKDNPNSLKTTYKEPIPDWMEKRVKGETPDFYNQTQDKYKSYIQEFENNPRALTLDEFAARKLQRTEFSSISELSLEQINKLKFEHTNYLKTANYRPITYSVFKGVQGAFNYATPGLFAGLAVGNPIGGVVGGAALGFGYNFAKSRLPRVFTPTLHAGLSGGAFGAMIGVGLAPLVGATAGGALALAAVGAGVNGTNGYLNHLYGGRLDSFTPQKLRNASIFKGIHGGGIGALAGLTLAAAVGATPVGAALAIGGGALAGSSFRYLNTKYFKSPMVKMPTFGGLGAVIGMGVGAALGLNPVVIGVGGAAAGAAAGWYSGKFGWKSKGFGILGVVGNVAGGGAGLYSGGTWLGALGDRVSDNYRRNGLISSIGFAAGEFNPTTTQGVTNIALGGAFAADIYSTRAVGQAFGTSVWRLASFYSPINTALTQYGTQLSMKSATTLLPSTFASRSLGSWVGWGTVLGTVLGGGIGLITGGGGGAVLGAAIGASTGATIGGIIGAIGGAVGGAIGGGGILSIPGVIAGAFNGWKWGSLVGGGVGGVLFGQAGAQLDKTIKNATNGIRNAISGLNALMTLSSIDFNKLNNPESIISLLMALISIMQFNKDIQQEAGKSIETNSSQTTAYYYNIENYVYASTETDINGLKLADGSPTYIVQETYLKQPNTTSKNAFNIIEKVEKGYWDFYNKYKDNNWNQQNFEKWNECNKLRRENCKSIVDSNSIFWPIDFVNVVNNRQYESIDSLAKDLSVSKKIIYIDQYFNLNNVEPGQIVFLSDQNPYGAEEVKVNSVGIVHSIEKDYIKTLEVNRASKENFYVIDFESPTLNFYNGKYIVGFGYL